MKSMKKFDVWIHTVHDRKFRQAVNRALIDCGAVIYGSGLAGDYVNIFGMIPDSFIPCMRSMPREKIYFNEYPPEILAELKEELKRDPMSEENFILPICDEDLF